MTGQLWDNSFMTHNQTLALTFDNQMKTTDCENNTLHIAQQGVAFAIVRHNELVEYNQLKKLQIWKKRAINIDIGNSETEILKVQIFNVSTSKVTTDIVYLFITFNNREKMTILCTRSQFL